MEHWWIYPLLFGGGVVAGFVNVLAGAGSALTLPLLIFSGLSPALANGSNRIGILLENALASRRFLRRGLVNRPHALRLALWTLPGAVLGAWSSVQISSVLFQKILVVVLFFSALTLYLPGELAQRLHRWPRRHPRGLYPAMLLLGFYGGFVQAGIGFLFLFTLRAFLDLPLAAINAYKTFIIAVYTLPTLGVFLHQGQVNWLLGGCLGAGAVLGADLSSRMTLGPHGEEWIKLVVTAVILLMGWRLWFS